MTENKNESENSGIIGMIKEGLSSISAIVSASIFPQLAKGVDVVMGTIDHRILRIERRIFRKMTSLSLLAFGGILLSFSFFFGLREFLGWSSAIAFFTVGTIIFIIGLLLKVGESGR